MSGHVQDFSFAASFPLPFRVLFLGGLGILGWATNLHGLELCDVDVVGAMELHAPRSRSSLPMQRPGPGFKLFDHQSTPYAPIYRLFVIYATWCLLAWAMYRYATHDNLVLVDVFRFIAAICGLGIVIALVSPFDSIQKRERDMFLHSIQRCLFSPLDRPTYFSDVVFADIFTSFAKVLGDVWLSICMLLPGNTILAIPAQEGWFRWIIPIIMSLPYVARLRQCLIDHYLPSNDNPRHLYNALKYATSFPVIFLSAAQRLVVSEKIEDAETVSSEHPLFRLWLLAAAVNSLYSFWWDVTNDWGLELLKGRSPTRGRQCSPPRTLTLLTPSASTSSTNGRALHNQYKTHPYGLRPTLLYSLPVYPLILFLNLILRMTWSIKLSSHLHSRSDGGELIFWLEIAELVRRWMWVFVRVEWEVVRKGKRAYEEEQYELMDSGHDGS